MGNLRISGGGQLFYNGDKINFRIQEFVPQTIYRKFGRASAWFVSEWQVAYAQFVRGRYSAPVYINNWHAGGSRNLRGTRGPETGLIKHLREELEEQQAQQVLETLTKCRGFDSEKLTLGSWLSQHKLKAAIDYDVKGMEADELRRDALDNVELFKSHGLTTLESGDFAPTWCHADSRPTSRRGIFIVKP